MGKPLELYQQPSLFDQPEERPAEVPWEPWEMELRDARSPAEREHLIGKLKAARPDGLWNGTIWCVPEDIPW